MPDSELASFRFRPDGDRVLTPPLDSSRFAYRIVLEGVIRFAHSGLEFDAVNRSGTGGPFSERHQYLQWSPLAPVLEREDPYRHRYVFRVPPEWDLRGDSVGVRLDLDQLVREYLITPSEARSALSGELRITVLQAGLTGAWAIPPAAWPAAAAIAGTAWVVRRRMLLAAPARERSLQEAVRRIERKYRAARAAAGSKEGRLLPIRERLTGVREGARALERQIRDLRRARGLKDRRSLERDLEALQSQLEACADAQVRAEGERALGEKRKSLLLVEDMEQAEARCLMRLDKIEAVLDSTCLALRSAALSRTGDRTAEAEAELCRDLDAEVAAVREVAETAPALTVGRA